MPDDTVEGRIKETDLIRALDGQYEVQEASKKRLRTACYVCGPPAMTDGFVAFLAQQPGMEEERVLCEKWW